MLVGKRLTAEMGNKRVFTDVDIAMSRGDKIGLVGPNGAGKTTLLRILAGQVLPVAGTVSNNGLEVGIVPQDLRGHLDKTVKAFVSDATGITAAQDAYNDAERAFNERPDDLDLLQAYSDAGLRLGHFGVYEFDGTLSSALRQAGLDDSFRERRLGGLSGGQRTRVALAAIMADRHDIVMLDEPTNNLDLPGLEILEEYIARSPAAFLMISHDRRFLRATTDRIVELIGGDRGVNNYGLGYDEYVEARVEAYLADRDRYAQYELARKGLVVAARSARIKANSAERGGSRRTDNDKLNANYRAGRASGNLAGQARGLETRIDQLDETRPDRPQEPISLDFLFPEDKEIVNGRTLLGLHDVSIVYDEVPDRSFGPFTLDVLGRDKIAIRGANGTGKSTLIKAITGTLRNAQISGDIYTHTETRMAYIDQGQSLPLPDASPLDNLLTLAPGTPRHEAMNLLVRFNLDRDTLTTMRSSLLSGGERAKILLASVAAKKANLLVLDEPTNNLDIPTIDALQEAIASYNGAVIVVSHDREFLDGIGVTQTINL